MQTRMLINGALHEGADGLLPVFNPSTAEVLIEIAEATTDQVNQAVEAAAAAFSGWSQSSSKERAEALLRIADIIDQHAPELARLDGLEDRSRTGRR